MTDDRTATDPASIEALLDESSALLRRGIALVQGGASLAGALECFDRAAALRRRLPLDGNPEHAYDLAACELNRGEALLRLVPVDRDAAIAAFDAGIALLQPLPRQEPRYQRRLAVALHNRGLARLESGATLDAAADFEQAIDALAHITPPSHDADELLATICVNFAASLQGGSRADEATGLLRRALDLQAPFERERETAAVISLQARHVLCLDIAAQLSGPPADHHQDLAATATDLAEDALEVVTAWERRGVSRLRPMGVGFFAFALATYAQFQPHFVDEFVAEWRDPSRSSEGFVTDPRLVAAADGRGPERRMVVRFVLDPPPAPERPTR